jgi:nitroreductase
MKKKIVGMLLCTLLFLSSIIPVIGLVPTVSAGTEQQGQSRSYVSLPPPEAVPMILEQSICRRMSYRAFTTDSVSDEDLSTVLWAAYGRTDNGGRTVYSSNGTYSTTLYVIRSDATYIYIPGNHSLYLFKTGNYLNLGEYTAPIKFGLVWNMSIATDEKAGMQEIGMIGQNIYFDANALDLATVTTGGGVSDLYLLGLPSNEKPEIIMPLGYPSPSYAFTYSPLPPSNLPVVVNNTFTLADAVNNRRVVDRWDGAPLTDLEQSQLIWSSYGFSYTIETGDHTRHRTLPSAIDIYPFKVFMANATGVYLYVPSTHSVTRIQQGDQRAAIAATLLSGNIFVSSAPVLFIPCLDTNVGSMGNIRWWWYEAGAIAHNVFLEMAPLNLTGNMLTVFTDMIGLRSALGVSGQTNIIPMIVVPVGHPYSVTPNNPPGTPSITGPANGKRGIQYNYTISAVDVDNDTVSYYVDWGDGTNTTWVGPCSSGESVLFNHTWAKRGTYVIKAKAKDALGAEGAWGTLQVTMPTSLTWQPFYNFIMRLSAVFGLLGFSLRIIL